MSIILCARCGTKLVVEAEADWSPLRVRCVTCDRVDELHVLRQRGEAMPRRDEGDDGRSA